MANKQEILQESYKALKFRYSDLESYYFDNFRLEAKGTAQIVTPENYYVKCSKSSKERFDMLHKQFKATLADALEALDSYKSGFFSDKEYASTVQLHIQELVGNADKILYYLNRFDVYVE